MAYKHGIYGEEVATSLNSPVQIDSGIVIAVGTAPIHNAKNPADLHKPILAYRYAEAVEQLGYSADFDSYTLCEVMSSHFSLYGVSPIVFVNVLDPAKHFDEVEKIIGGVTEVPPTITGDIDSTTFKITSGDKIPAVTFETDIDFEVRTDEVEDLDEETTEEVITLHILSGDKVVDSKIKLTYRTAGGTDVETEVTLHGLIYELPSDTVIHSVTVESGGVDTLQNLIEGTDYEVAYSDGVASFTILDDTKITDDTIKIKYHEINPSKVTAEDIIGGIDNAGQSTGLELVESVYPVFNLVPGIIIAPKFSQELRVITALTAKAKSVSGMFGAMAIADLDTELVQTYTAAVEYKKSKLISDPHLIICWPKVASGGVQYHMSTQLASLLNRVDVEAGNIPYVSPSNQTLQMDAAILKNGTEVYLTRDQANFLNQNGIGTALSFVGWKFWGNRTSAYPASNDPRENFIPVRRMFNFISATFITSYLGNLDMPVNRRMIDSVVNAANIYLNGLVNRGCLLGGRIEFSSEDNPTADLMDGLLKFHLYITPPSPARSLTFLLEYDPEYIATLFA